MSRPPLPPFTAETASQKARMAEDAWNTRDPARVALAYTADSRWRNRAEFIQGRAEIEAFLTRKWNRELEYRLIKEVWAFRENRIAVRFAYEWHDDSGNWFRSHGNENWASLLLTPSCSEQMQHPGYTVERRAGVDRRRRCFRHNGQRMNLRPLPHFDAFASAAFSAARAPARMLAMA